MGVVNTNTSQSSGAGPHTVSINLAKGSGNNRAVVILMALFDAIPAAHTCTFDPTGVNFAMSSTITLIEHSVTSDLWLAAWYILDSDLPSGTGTFDVDVTHTLSDNGVMLAAYYLEDVTQSAPTSGTAESDSTITPSLSTSASSTDFVMDVWQSDENFGTYTPDSGQTEVADIKNGNFVAFSSHRVGSGNMGWTNDNTASQNHIGGFVFMSPVSAPSVSIPVIMNHLRNQGIA